MPAGENAAPKLTKGSAKLNTLIRQLRKNIDDGDDSIKYVRDPEMLIVSLKALADMIGNDDIKVKMATQVAFLISLAENEAKYGRNTDDEFKLSAALYGPPGGGKTTIGTKLGNIYYALGYLNGGSTAKKPNTEGQLSVYNADGTYNTDVLYALCIILVGVLVVAGVMYYMFGWVVALIAFALGIILVITAYYGSKQEPDAGLSKTNQELRKRGSAKKGSDNSMVTVVSRDDFVDMWSGWTAGKTKKLLMDNLGKVLLIDEAYSLYQGHGDNFGIEALTVLNLFMSQHPRDIVVIFAGYKDLMYDGIMRIQPGLQRRIMWHYNCGDYSGTDLYHIFMYQLAKVQYKVRNRGFTRGIIEANAAAFANGLGGDTERVIYWSRLAHSDELFERTGRVEPHILEDRHIVAGIEDLYTSNDNAAKKVKPKPTPNFMEQMAEYLQGSNELSPGFPPGM